MSQNNFVKLTDMKSIPFQYTVSGPQNVGEI